MEYTVDQVVAKYVELRDKKAELAARHKEELSPINEALENMERWLLAQMTKTGVDSFKTAHGTAFKALSASVAMQDAVAFKTFVLAPAVEQIATYLKAQDVELEPHDIEHFNTILADAPRWAVTDLRAGKKGIQEYIEENKQEVPGVAVTSVLNVNIRRA